MFSIIPSPFAIPLAKQVFPAPRGPFKATILPFSRERARFSPMVMVSYGDELSRMIGIL